MLPGERVRQATTACRNYIRNTPWFGIGEEPGMGRHKVGGK